MMYRGNTAPQNFSQNSPKILHYLGTIYLLSITQEIYSIRTQIGEGWQERFTYLSQIYP